VRVLTSSSGLIVELDLAHIVAPHHLPALLKEEHAGRDGRMAMRWTRWPMSAFSSDAVCRKWGRGVRQAMV